MTFCQTCKAKTAEENNPGVEHASDKSTRQLVNPEQEHKFPNNNSQTSALKGKRTKIMHWAPKFPLL